MLYELSLISDSDIQDKTFLFGIEHFIITSSSFIFYPEYVLCENVAANSVVMNGNIHFPT